MRIRRVSKEYVEIGERESECGPEEREHVLPGTYPMRGMASCLRLGYRPVKYPKS
jgi:hypothetical protein